jgi:ribulose 1,5-bisphosphate synthetase/thiazole synthase
MKISRRAFLAATGGAVTLGPLAACAAERPAAPGDRPADSVRTVHIGRPALPILRRAETVVVGGGFAGVSAAIHLARAGRKVVLVEPRTYLGRELTATLRPWLTRQDPLPEVLKACAGPAIAAGAGPEIPLKLDTVKLSLEDLLIAAGVGLLYASMPVGLCTEGDWLAGLIIGNKSGRQVLACRMIIDATETASVARVAGAVFEPPPAQAARFQRTLEFDGVAGPAEPQLAVPAELGIADNRVTLHRGCRGEGHVLVECGLDLPIREFEPADAMQREVEARRRTMKLASHLVAHVPAFAKAYFAAGSYELAGPATSRMQAPAPDWAKGLPALDGLGTPAAPWPLAALAGPMRGLWCLGESARLDLPQIESLRQPATACLAGEAFANTVHAHWHETASAAGPSRAPIATGAPSGTVEVREPFSPDPARRYEMQPVPSAEVPVFRDVDVLVVGGGTSGATAAATAAREGMKTFLVEMNPGLGGTGTIGGVDSYWFGRRVGFAARVTQRVKEVHEGINHQPAAGGKWNIEAKMFALLEEATRAGVEVLFGGLVVGAVVEPGSRVRGVVIATRYGLRAALAKVVIDATGDGDVAAFAGAGFVKCSAMDHIGMWYTLAQFTRPGRNANSFTSSLDVTNVDDCTRAILVGRRRGDKCHDHGAYLAVRESRHILADAVLTLTDQLRHRSWPDVVNIHYSNHDMKGKTTSQWHQSGMIPPNIETEIPYRVLLPKGLENILVAGKAFSTNHDGLAAIRMQADLENLGGVVALAAAMAVKAGKTPRAINIAELQARLAKEGVLPESVLTRTLKPRRHTDDELRALVAALVADKPLLDYQDMKMGDAFRGAIPFVEVCTAGPRIVPLLESALKEAPEDRKVVLAQALAVYGSAAGVPVLVKAAEAMLAGPKIPARTRRILHAGVPPDQGAAPEVVYLIYSLGMARDKRSLAVWQRVADILDPKEEDFRSATAGTFCYVDAVCFGAERLGDPAAVPIIEKLHAYPTLHGLATRQGFLADYMPERRAMLELAIAKALARSGSPKGFDLLIAYLDDNRALLAEQAHANLARIAGQDLGKDSAAWSAWLEGAKASLRPRPLTDDLDTAYESDILIA